MYSMEYSVLVQVCQETGEFGVRGETLGPPNPQKTSRPVGLQVACTVSSPLGETNNRR